MDKYQKLWDYVAAQDENTLELTFDEIAQIAGVSIDHSFLTYKKDLLPLGFQVDHIFMKKKLVRFVRTPSRSLRAKPPSFH